VGHLNVIKLPPALRTLLAQEAFGFLRQQQALTEAQTRGLELLPAGRLGLIPYLSLGKRQTPPEVERISRLLL
jgi:hypothetical protein